MTLCFSAAQALLAAKAGAYIVSPFVGRLDDIGWAGMELIRSIVTIYRNYGYRTQILAASLRSPTHVIEASLAGAHIATMPFKVLDMLFSHPLTDKGLDQFLKDGRRFSKKLRPPAESTAGFRRDPKLMPGLWRICFRPSGSDQSCAGGRRPYSLSRYQAVRAWPVLGLLTSRTGTPASARAGVAAAKSAMPICWRFGEKVVFYSYDVAGVEYTASQDVSRS